MPSRKKEIIGEKPIVKQTKDKIKKIVKEVVTVHPEFIPFSEEIIASYSSGRGGVGNANVSVNTAAHSISPTLYQNILQGVNPCYAGAGTYGGVGTNGVGLQWMANLCMLAYYNVPSVTATINLQKDFSRSKILFQGGNEQSRRFYQAWFKKINGWNLQNQFFINYYGPANVPILRLNSSFQKDELLNKTSTLYAKYAKQNGVELTAEKVKGISVKYWFLNPALLYINSAFSYYNPTYSLMISANDLKALQNPLSKSDKDWVKNLDIDLKELAKTSSGFGGNVLIPLTPENFMIIFNNKMDYQPYAVSPLFPVLSDIDAKISLKKMDSMIALWVQQAILHVQMGDLEKKIAPSPAQIQGMQQMLAVGTVGKSIVTDNLTKIEFKIPKVGDILDPKKYDQLNSDIAQGLNNVLFGADQKFADAQIKIQIFLSRLKDGRQTFLNDFLIPEMERIGEILNFKSIPTPVFEDADFKDDVNFGRIAAQLMQLGILTPEGGITALQTGRLPSKDENIEQQREYRDLKENEELFSPIIMQKDENIDETAGKPKGRPTGTKNISQKPRKTGKIGKNAAADYQFDAAKILKYYSAAENLEKNIISYIKEKVGRKKLTKEQLELVPLAAEIIISNEEPENWDESVKKYVDRPVGENFARLSLIDEIATEHNKSIYESAIYFASKVEEGK